MGARYFFLNPTGGIWYHYLALKYARKCWMPFKQELQKVLSQWQPQSEYLVIVGASGGYCLTEDFLKRFRKIETIEPDPIARWIFNRRFKNLKKNVTFNAHPVFNPLFSLEGLDQFFSSYTDATLLFSNLLGQLRLLAPDDSGFLQWKAKLGEHLSNRGNWFSFHDRLTSSEPLSAEHLSIQGSVEDWVKSQALKPGTEIVDHDLEGIFRDTSIASLQWELYPGSYHLIECRAAS